MKRTDEFNNYGVLNPDGAQSFKENFVSASENGGDFVLEDSSNRVSENQRFDELSDERSSNEMSKKDYGNDSLSDEAKNNLSDSDTVSNGVADSTAGVSNAAAETASAATTTGSALTGVASSIASVVVAVVVAVTILIPSLKVSQIFAGPFSMAFSVDFSSEFSLEEEQGGYWYAVLEGEDDFLQSAELREQTSYIEFYDLKPDSPYTLRIYRSSEDEDGEWKEEEQYSGVFYTAKESQNEIFIEVFNFENEELRFAFFDSEEGASKLYTVRVTDVKGNDLFVKDVGEPGEFFVGDVKSDAYITVSVNGEVAAFRNVEYWYEPYEPVDLEYFTITFVADGKTVGSYSYRYNEDITYLPDVPYKEGYTGEWGYIPHETATVEAIYTPIYVELQYIVRFYVDGEEYATRVFTGEYENLTDLPEVPEKPGYYGEWSTPERPGNFAYKIFAEYTPIIYTATFIADDEIVGTVEFTVEDEGIDEPTIPKKDGYNGKWPEYALKAENVTINAVYEPIIYTATFIADGEIVGTVEFTVEDEGIDEPLVPEIEGFVGEWETYYLAPMDIEVYAHYREIVDYFTVTFMADGKVVEEVSFMSGTMSINEPEVPTKEGYIGEWEPYQLRAEDFVVNAVYTEITEPVEVYTAYFYADNTLVGSKEFTAGDRRIADPPAVPAKTGYICEWEWYELGDADITIQAIYTPIEYHAYFYADGELVSDEVFTVETERINEPEIPQKDGYKGAWSEYTLEVSDVTINAIYEMITYTVTFVADGEIVDVKIYYYGQSSRIPPLLPEKEGYEGRWGEIPLSADGTVYAVYTPITYIATFVANGEIVDEVPFTIEDEAINAPPVPESETQGIIGVWEAYSISATNLTINAIYTDTMNTATFMIDNEEFAVVRFVLGSNIDEPQMPQRDGYSGRWECYEKTENGDVYMRAVYTPIIYTATFVADGEPVGVVEFTVEDNGIAVPDFPEKEGYEGWWDEFAIEASDITINANYEPIEYTATFIADNELVGTVEFTVEDEAIDEPTVPEKEGYIGYWSEYGISAASIEVVAIYEPITYTATFIADGRTIAEILFTVETEVIEAPQAPEKSGYDVVWSEYTLGASDIRVEAIYTPIEYTATFVADGRTIAEIPFTIETEVIEVPSVPSVDGYTGEWEEYTLGTQNITINAIYTPITYTATFVADGRTIAEIPFTIETELIEAPQAPEKSGYDVVWSEYTLGTSDIRVEAIYTPIAYTATFVANRQTVAEVKFTVETEEFDEPEVPSLEGYTGEWETYVLGASDITVNAIYTIIEYNAVFVTDEGLVASRTFTVETEVIDEPEVPYREGYIGYWEPYVLGNSDITVHAVYEAEYHTAYFYDENGGIVATVVFIEGTNAIEEPEVPYKEGFKGAWEPYELGTEDIHIRPTYWENDEPLEMYTAYFYAENTDKDPCYEIDFSPNDTVLELPPVPEKLGYMSAWSDDYELGAHDVYIYAIYTPIQYTAKFIVDGVVYKAVAFTLDDEAIEEPTVPEKEGFVGHWSEYSMEPNDISIEAIYERIGDDPTQGQGYFTVFYRVNGDYVTSMQYPKDTGIQPFDYPYGDEGYIISDWRYTPVGDDSEDMYADADYTPVIDNPTYITVHYMVDGEEIETVVYLQGDDMPSREVPERKGFTGEWQYRESADEPDVIYAYALYTQIADDPTQGQEYFTVFYRVNEGVVYSREYETGTPESDFEPYQYMNDGYAISSWVFSYAEDGSGNMYADPKDTTSGNDPAFGNMTNIGN